MCDEPNPEQAKKIVELLNESEGQDIYLAFQYMNIALLLDLNRMISHIAFQKIEEHFS